MPPCFRIPATSKNGDRSKFRVPSYSRGKHVQRGIVCAKEVEERIRRAIGAQSANQERESGSDVVDRESDVHGVLRNPEGSDATADGCKLQRISPQVPLR